MANLDKWLQLSFICPKPYSLGGWANGAAVAQRLYTPLVGGSNPSSPTIPPPFFRDQGGPWGDYSRAPSITAPKIPSITSKTSFSRFLRRRLGLDVSLAGGTHTAFGEPD